MLTLSETESTTLQLETPVPVMVDLAVSEALLAADAESAQAIYKLITTKFPLLWPVLVAQIVDNPWLTMARQEQQTLHYSVILVTNPEIQQLNRDFRNKDQATDVLTFSLLEDASEESRLIQLPEISLGEVYISLPWAQAEICKQTEMNSGSSLNFFPGLSLFILERLIHGTLHLMGVHHNTIPDYNKVIAIQNTVVHAVT